MSSSRKAKRGFSLLEVVIALTILVLLAGSVYSVLRGGIDAAATIRESQARQQQIDGFVDLCRAVFHQLSAQAAMEGRIREAGGKALPEIIFRNCPELFSWGNINDREAVSVLGLVPQVGGRFSLSLLRFNPGGDFLADPVAKAKSEDWITLVPDVTSLSWRFLEPGSNNWLPLLPQGSKRPGAVEMNLQLADLKEPIRMVFNIVPMTSPVSADFKNPGNSRNQNPIPPARTP